jgi:hypothetical protein
VTSANHELEVSVISHDDVISSRQHALVTVLGFRKEVHFVSSVDSLISVQKFLRGYAIGHAPDKRPLTVTGIRNSSKSQRSTA